MGDDQRMRYTKATQRAPEPDPTPNMDRRWTSSEAQGREHYGRMGGNEKGFKVAPRRQSKGASLEEALSTRPGTGELAPDWMSEGDTRTGSHTGVNPAFLQQRSVTAGISPTQVNAAALQRLGRSGMPERLGDIAAMQQSQAARRAQLGGALQQQDAAARQMGISKGGMALAAQLGAVGGAGGLSAQDAAALGAMQTDRQLAAQHELAKAASLYRDQAFEEARRLAAAEDQTQLFDTSYQQAVRQRDMDRLARSAMDQAKARELHRAMGLTSLQATQADRDYIENVERQRRAAETKEQVGVAALVSGLTQKVVEVLRSIYGGGGGGYGGGGGGGGGG